MKGDSAVPGKTATNTQKWVSYEGVSATTTSPKHSETCHFPASVMPQLTSQDGTKHGRTKNPAMASGVCETETDFAYACLISDILKCAF